MKTVTSNFAEIQKRPEFKVARRVEYKRRYFTGAAYTWESEWSTLAPEELISVSNVTWNLDNDILNEFKTSNVTLTLLNKLGRFNPHNRSGFFGPASATGGQFFEPFWTKFRIRSGVLLDDGTEELVTIFTGYASGGFNFNSADKTVSVTVFGPETLLERTKAEGIATFITSEAAGSGDGTRTEFETVHPGVGAISIVTVAGAISTETASYTVADLNTPNRPAKVRFKAPPKTGEAVTLSYYYWPANISIDGLVESLLDAADVPAGKRDVDAVNFPSLVNRAFNFDNFADFDSALTKDGVMLTADGKLKIDFATWIRDASGWSSTMTGWTTTLGSATSSGGAITAGGSQWYGWRAGGGKLGAWRFSWTPAGSFSTLRFVFIGKANGAGTFDGYWFVATRLGSVAPYSYTFSLWKNSYDGDVESSLTQIAYHEMGGPSGIPAFRIVRSGDYRIQVFVGFPSFLELKILDVVDQTDFQSPNIQVGLSGTSSIQFIDKAPIPPSAPDPVSTWASATIDMGPTASAFLPLEFNPWILAAAPDAFPGFDIEVETRTSADDSSWDSWEPVNQTTGMPTSTFRRYGQIRAKFSLAPIASGQSQSVTDPTVDLIRFRWRSEETEVELPALSGYNVFSAIQAIAKLANYEVGFTPEERFFFRSRTIGASAMTITAADLGKAIPTLTPGYDRLFSAIRVTYDSVTKEIELPQIEARAGANRLEVSIDSNIKLPPDSDLSESTAQTLSTFLGTLRRRATLNTKILPQLDLGDVITVDFVDTTPSPKWYWGDPNVHWGDTTVHYWGKGNQLIADTDFKVIGINHDLEGHQSEIELEEAIT